MAPDKILMLFNFGYIVLVALGSFGIYQLTSWVNAEKDRELERFQAEANTKIEQSQNQAASAEAQAAVANARAAEAQLELARIKEPRRIAREDQQMLVARLTPFAGQRYDLTVFLDGESKNLLWSINSLLNAAGWVYTDGLAKGIAVSITPELKVQPSLLDGLGATIQIDMKSESTLRALAALRTGMEEAGLDFSAGGRHDPIENAPSDLIVIYVGKKRL